MSEIVRIPIKERGQVVAYASIDAVDLPLVGADRWYVLRRPANRSIYAQRGVYVEGKDRKLLMHRVIMGLTWSDGQEVDHIDGDGLNNRRSNLRIVTSSQNKQNLVRLNSNNTSGYRGVVLHRRAGKWQAQSHSAGRRVYLGLFPTPEDANNALVSWRKEHMPFAPVAKGGRS